MRKLCLLVGAVLFLLLIDFQAIASKKTWTGSLDSKWNRKENWSPSDRTPLDGDTIVLDGTGINRDITNFTSINVAKFIVSAENGTVQYSLTSNGKKTLEITGGDGEDLDIQAGCSLVFKQKVSFIVDEGCSAMISGSLLTDQTGPNQEITFMPGSSVTLNGVMEFNGDPGVDVTIGEGVVVNGTGSILHNSGNMIVDGTINIGGNFTNGDPVQGDGTIEIGGVWTNTSTLFNYNSNPPGNIISDYTWKGTGSTSWNNPANWYSSDVPGNDADVVIYTASNMPVISSADRHCRRLYIHNDGSFLTISPAGQLTVSGETTLGGGGSQGISLLIQSDATGTGSFIDNGTITYGTGATVGVRRTLTGGKWHYMSMPFATINAWSFYGLYMKYYSEPLHRFKYVIAPGVDSTLNSMGLGYAMWAGSTTVSDLVNDSLNTGDITIPVTRSWDNGSNSYDGWNLVGNPYPSSLDLASPGITRDHVEATAWFWDPGAGNYKVWSAGGGGSHSKYCPPQQAFFVHCNDPSATHSVPGQGSMQVSNQARVHSTQYFLKSTDEPANLLTVKVEGTANAYNDEMGVIFNDTVTNGYDADYDAEKISGDAAAPQIYTTIPDYKLSVNALPFSLQAMVVPAGFKANINGTYTLTAGNIESFQPDVTIQLEDLQEGMIQDLRTNPVYVFNHLNTDDPGRFLLHFGDPNLGGIDTGHPGSAIDIYSYNGRIYVKYSGTDVLSGEISVVDMLGRSIFGSRLENNHLQEFSVTGVHGCYLVIVNSPDVTVYRKVIL